MIIKDLILNGNASAIAYWIEGIFYITGLFLIAGIDKEKKEIRNEVLLYIVITETLYIIYLYISEHVDVYRYVMYLFIFWEYLFIDVSILESTNHFKVLLIQFKLLLSLTTYT